MINYQLKLGNTPLFVTAIHDGHQIRPEVLPHFSLLGPERLREEDPFTGAMTDISPFSLVVQTSRFETDLNRPPEKAVYMKPADAWGLQLYHEGLPEETAEISRNNYAAFYAQLHGTLTKMLEDQPWLIVYDLHSYNHRRENIDRFAAPADNPEINVGTGNTDPIWRPVIDELIESMRTYNFRGRHLDVRENVKFRGGYFSKWLTDNFGARVCPIAIEFKKFFMNEWTGEADHAQLASLKQMLIHSITPTLRRARQAIQLP